MLSKSLGGPTITAVRARPAVCRLEVLSLLQAEENQTVSEASAMEDENINDRRDMAWEDYPENISESESSVRTYDDEPYVANRVHLRPMPQSEEDRYRNMSWASILEELYPNRPLPGHQNTENTNRCDNDDDDDDVEVETEEDTDVEIIPLPGLRNTENTMHSDNDDVDVETVGATDEEMLDAELAALNSENETLTTGSLFSSGAYSPDSRSSYRGSYASEEEGDASTTPEGYETSNNREEMCESLSPFDFYRRYPDSKPKALPWDQLPENRPPGFMTPPTVNDFTEFSWQREADLLPDLCDTEDEVNKLYSSEDSTDDLEIIEILKHAPRPGPGRFRPIK